MIQTRWRSDSPIRVLFRPLLRRIVLLGARVVATGCLLCLLLLGALQSDRVSTWFVTQLAGFFNPYPGTSLTVERASGSWVRSLRFEGIRLAPVEDRGPGGPSLTLDSLTVRFRLLPILVKRVEIREASITGFQAVFTQRPDSLWDILLPFQTVETPVPEGKEEGGFSVRTGPIRIQESTASLLFAPGGPHGIPDRMEVEELTLALASLEVGGGSLTARLDTLYARLLPPGEDLDRVFIEGKGSLADGRVVIPGLTLQSGLSDVSTAGTLLIPREKGGEVEEIDFYLRATPLAFRDISGFIPALDPEVSAQADLRVLGRASLVDVSGDLTMSNGGKLELDGTFTPSISGPVEFRLQAAVSELGLGSFLGGGGTIGGLVDGDVAVNVEGRDLAHLTGDLSIRTEGLRFGQLASHPLLVSGDLLDGEAKLEVEAGAYGLGRVQLLLEGRPLDPDPTLHAQGTFYQDRSPARSPVTSLEDAGLRGLETRFSLRTSGFSVDSAVAELAVETLKGSYRELGLEGGTMKASWIGGEGVFQLSQPVGNGRLRTTGEVAWREGSVGEEGTHRVLKYSLPDLELLELDLLHLLGDTLPSRLNARISLSGVGTEPGTLQAEARARLLNSEVRGVVLDSALFQPKLEDGALSADFQAWLKGSVEEMAAPREGGAVPEQVWAGSRGEGAPAGGPQGRLTASLRGRPFDAEPFLILDSLIFSGIDLTSITGPSSNLSGLVEGRMDGMDPRTGKLSGRMSLRPSRVRDATVDSAEVDLSLAEGTLLVSGRLSSKEGDIRLDGSAHPFAEPMEFRLNEGAIRGLDLGDLLGQDSLHSDLNLDLSLAGSGSSLGELVASGGLVVLPSTLNRGSIQGGTVTLEVGESRGSARGLIRTGEGEVTLQALASFAGGLNELRAEGDLNLPDLAEFLFLDVEKPEVGARGRVHLSWASNDGLGFASEVEGRIGAATIDTLDLRGSIREGILELSTVRLRSDILGADGGGRLALQGASEDAGPSDLMLTATVLDLSPLGPLFGLGELAASSGRGELHVTGLAGAPSMAGSLNLGRWRLKGISGDSALVRADYTPDGATLAMWIQSPKGPGSVELSLQAEARPQESRGTLMGLDISTPDHRWALNAPVPLSWKDGALIDGLVLSSDIGTISADGIINTRGDQDLTVRLDQVSLSGMTGLFQLEDLNLLAHGQMKITGPAASPRAEGELRVDLGLLEGAPTSVETRFSLGGGELALDAEAVDSSGGVLTLRGALPMAFSLAPSETGDDSGSGNSPSASPSNRGSVDLVLRADAFDISWARALVPGRAVDELEGVLSIDARASGPPDQPVLEGRIDLTGGLFHVPVSGTRYSEIDLSAELSDREVRIRRAFVRSGPGSAEIEGSVGIRGFRPDTLRLAAHLDRFLAWKDPVVSATLTGDISLGGTVQEPRVAGNLDLEGSAIGLDDVSPGGAVSAIELTVEDYQMLEEYFGYQIQEKEDEPSWTTTGVGLDLVVSFDRDVWVRRSIQPTVSLEVSGELEIKKEPAGELQVIGTVETLPERSYFRQFGRRFAVSEGALDLSGDPSDFSFRMDAQWQVTSHTNPDEAEVVVNLEVVGDAESLELTLGSDPDMDEADIISYLATGKPQSALSSTDSDAAGLGTSMAMGAMAGVLEGLVGEAVELDVVEIKVDPVKGTTLVAGRYISPDLYLGFRQPVTFSESSKKSQSENQYSEVEIDYRWFRWLSMNVQGGASEIRLYLRARYAY